MWQMLRQIARTGIVSEPAPQDADGVQLALRRIQQELLAVMGRALTIRHVDAGSCNGCELEIHALGNPYYNLEGLGIRFVASPRHADLLLVTGPVSRHMAEALRRTWDAVPEPRLVLAVGDCGCDGGIFGAGYASCGRVADVIPVDAVVPGCPPTPLALMKGILAVVGRARVGAEATHAGRGSGRTALHDMDGPETVPSAGASAMPTAPAAAATGALPHSRPSVAWPPAPAGDATSSRP
ncbi:MAG: NADH-quinone oxidoreductase subunit B family protein [Planctomycetes bacterium]|jgi:Ni,Fe-hydrogenase III small subunit|nr:NADH-quinone oxidoreductase subunit B family protein [Planctomycetota bacterium]